MTYELSLCIGILDCKASLFCLNDTCLNCRITINFVRHLLAGPCNLCCHDTYANADCFYDFKVA